MLLETQKGITLDQVEHAVALARANGLRVWSKFILGHPHETRETVRDTMRFIAKTNPDKLSVSIMTPFPGTPIHEMALRGEGGYRLLSGGWEDFDKYSSGVLELETISLGQLKRYQIACYVNLYARNRRFAELGGWSSRTARWAWRCCGRPSAERPARRWTGSRAGERPPLRNRRRDPPRRRRTRRTCSPRPFCIRPSAASAPRPDRRLRRRRPTLRRPNSFGLPTPGPLSWSRFVEATGNLAYHRRRDLGVTRLEVSNVKRVLVSMGAVLVAAALALPALASAPQRDPVSQNQVVQGQTSCGLLRWEIHLTGDRFRFFDEDGLLERVQVHISEDNTITNLDTGETYREGPDNFMQTTLFTDDGPLIVATGLAANVPGAQLKDVGRVVIDPLTGEIVFSAGQHPLRDAQEAGNVLEGFCALFD